MIPVKDILQGTVQPQQGSVLVNPPVLAPVVGANQAVNIPGVLSQTRALYTPVDLSGKPKE